MAWLWKFLGGVTMWWKPFLESALKLWKKMKVTREGKKQEIDDVLDTGEDIWNWEKKNFSNWPQLTQEIIEESNFPFNPMGFLYNNPDYKFDSLEILNLFLWEIENKTLSMGKAYRIYEATSEISIFRRDVFFLADKVGGEYRRHFLARCFKENIIHPTQELEQSKWSLKYIHIPEREITVDDENNLVTLNMMWDVKIIWKWISNHCYHNTLRKELTFRLAWKKDYIENDTEIFQLEELVKKISINYWMRHFLSNLYTTTKAQKTYIFLNWKDEDKDLLKKKEYKEGALILKKEMVRHLDLNSDEIQLIEKISWEGAENNDFAFCNIIILCIKKLIDLPLPDIKGFDGKNQNKKPVQKNSLSVRNEELKYIKTLPKRDFEINAKGEISLVMWKSKKRWLIDTWAESATVDNNIYREICIRLGSSNDWYTATDTVIQDFVKLLLEISGNDLKRNYLTSMTNTSEVKKLDSILNKRLTPEELQKERKYENWAIILKKEYIEWLWLSQEDIDLIEMFSWEKKTTHMWNSNYNFCCIITVGIKNMIKLKSSKQ